VDKSSLQSNNCHLFSPPFLSEPGFAGLVGLRGNKTCLLGFCTHQKIRHQQPLRRTLVLNTLKQLRTPYTSLSGSLFLCVFLVRKKEEEISFASTSE
jgi:hypothetical protein